MRKLILSMILAVAGVMMASAQADGAGGVRGTVYLNSGNSVSGLVVKQPSGEVTVTLDGGTVMTYSDAQVRRIDFVKVPERGSGRNLPEGGYVDHNELNSGFWGAVELSSGISVRMNSRNIGFEELHVIGGYRFNDFLRVGLGLGARWYWNNDDVRFKTTPWTMPLFLDVRGLFMSQAYRTCVPFYDLQAGVTFPDGFMFRPTIGLKIGERRSAFTVSLSYMGQMMTEVKDRLLIRDKDNKLTNRYNSFVVLNLGYEF